MSSLMLGLLVALFSSMGQPPHEGRAPASPCIAAPRPAPAHAPAPTAVFPALESDEEWEGDGTADGSVFDCAVGTVADSPGEVEPAGARARAVNLKFATFVHVLRGQARATPTAGTRAPPLR